MPAGSSIRVNRAYVHRATRGSDAERRELDSVDSNDSVMRERERRVRDEGRGGKREEDEDSPIFGVGRAFNEIS